MAAKRSNTVWILVALVAAIAFVIVIRLLLDRTSQTALRVNSFPDVASVPHLLPEADPHDAAPATSNVAMVYGCVDQSGAESWQSQPCAPGQRTVRAIPAAPDVEPVRRAQSVASTAPVNTHVYRNVHVATGIDERTQSRQACRQARLHREETLERVGLKRTYDLLQQLDAMVSRACKGL